MPDGARPEGGEGLGGLAGIGGSRRALSIAMRARDVSRPRPEHTAAAERRAEATTARTAGPERPSR